MVSGGCLVPREDLFPEREKSGASGPSLVNRHTREKNVAFLQDFN